MATEGIMGASRVTFHMEHDIPVHAIGINMEFKNGAKQVPFVMHNAKVGYLLEKGVELEQTGYMTLQVLRTPDGDANDGIKHLQDFVKETTKKNKPDDYNKDFTVTIKGAGDEDHVHIHGKGYVSEVKATDTVFNNETVAYEATVVIYEPGSVHTSH